MKTLFIALIALISLTRLSFAQDFPEFERFIQIADSIWTNVRIHGPHWDASYESCTYYKIDEHNYVKVNDIYVNDSIRERISWYVFKGEPIILRKEKRITFHTQGTVNTKLNLDIVYYISNRKLIGIHCIGYVNNEKISEIRKFVEEGIRNKMWL